jgi:MYXO-CTERM domain-containing protein
MVRGVIRGVGVLAIAVAGASAGCAGDEAAPVAHNRVVVAEPEPELVMSPLSVAAGANPAPTTTMALATDVAVDARLLVITADGTSATVSAIKSALDYLGTPYDVIDASNGAPLTADALGTADHGRYQGILLDSGDLSVSSTSAFSDAEWTALTTYEARFGVRRAVAYMVPSAAYGLTSAGGLDAKAAPLSLTCTAAGKLAFVGANCDGPVAIEDGWAYRAQPTDASTVPLLVDASGNVFAATHAYPDGREALMLTFSQSPTAFHTPALMYGVINWVTRGLFIGEKHVYASPQIDDLFLASAIYTGGTYRITNDDFKAFKRWQDGLRADPLTANFRSSFAFNASGAKPPSQDHLTDEVHELEAHFTFINHTWDHKELTAMSYADAFEEFSQNHQYAAGLPFTEYTVENLVTPGITGLDNAEVMRAAFDVGIRQLVSDTSVAGQGNPSPNAGYYNAQNPDLLVMPRRPLDLYFNVSQPSEWMVEYAARHAGVASTYDQMIAATSDSLARYLLRGENDAWMFHQANLRDIGGGKSLLSDVLDAAFAKYAARSTLPVLSPTMDDLSARVEGRMDLNASNVTATIGPGATLSVQVVNGATVPITGLCTPSAEIYAGQRISYLQLPAGGSMTLSLATDCNPGVTGTGGPGDGVGGTAVGSLGNGDGGLGSGVAPDAGCGCLVSDGARGGGVWALALALVGWALARRRR